MSDEFSLEDVLIILRRRIWFFLVPAMIIAPLGFAIVMAMPSMYRAQGTILVESQQIPSDLVRSTINAYAQERIQTIRQRVMTLNRANAVADKFTVFDQESRLSQSERAQIMRQRLGVNLITVKHRAGSGDGTIAFNVSFSDRDPQKAYLVANEFITLFLAEDVRTRTAGASNTTEFFERESEKLRQSVADIETKIVSFKAENADALPEHLNMNLGLLDRASTDLDTIMRSNEQLEEEKQFLASQLMTGARSDRGLSGQLAALEAQLAILRATYYDGYPEVEATKDQIAAIKRQMAPSATIQRLRREMAEADAALTTLERDGNPDPAELEAAEARIEAARQALSDQISTESRDETGDPSNLMTEGRIAIIDNRLRMNNRRADKLRAELSDIESRVARTPAVERELATLSRDYDNLEREYLETRAKQQDAQLAQNLEEDQRAEKFSILEPAVRPHRPSSPDRPKLMVLVVFAALGAGGAAALLAEFALATIRGRAHLGSLTGDHPIAVVPYIPANDGARAPLKIWKRRKNRTQAPPDVAPETAQPQHAYQLEYWDMDRIRHAISRARSESPAAPAQTAARATATAALNAGGAIETLEKVQCDAHSFHKHRIISNEQDPVLNAFRVMRTRVLQKMEANGWRTIAVVSPGAGAGKTVTAINLSIALGWKSGIRPTLVDVDFYRPSVARYLGISNFPSVLDFYEGSKTIDDVTVRPDLPDMLLMPNERVTRRGAEFLSSEKTDELLDTALNRYGSKIVIFDLSPLLGCDDAIAFLPKIDCVLLIAASGQTRVHELKEAKRVLGKTNILGSVLNKSPRLMMPNPYY